MTSNKLVRGFPCPAADWFTEKNLQDAMDYIPHDGDVVIASFPKTGTTWMQYIVLQIMSGGREFPSFNETLRKFAPHLEFVGSSAVDAMEKPRIYKHHFPYDRVEKNAKSKCIYIHRRPEDTCSSYYHFINGILKCSMEFDSYFESFLKGDMPYGNYFDHIDSFLKHEEEDNLLIVSYETLMSNGRDEVLRIAEFLGEEYHRMLLEDSELLEKVLERTSFDYMKKHLSMSHPSSIVSEKAPHAQPGKVDFFRKGIVGDGKKLLSFDQMERLRNTAKEMLKDHGRLLKEWFDE